MKKNILLSFLSLSLLLFFVSCKKLERDNPAEAEKLTVSTSAIIGNSSTVTTGGKITYSGAHAITARGVCWNTAPNPSITDNHTTDGAGIGEFVSSVTGLAGNTEYYVRAYATNNNETAYGEELSIVTVAGLPLVFTNPIVNINAATASCGGNIIIDGGNAVTSRGVCWSTAPNPTITDNLTTDGTGIGAFVSSITGLAGNTQYYVRAYATNSAGTGYGINQIRNGFVIGNQPWTQENLAVSTYRNGDPIPEVQDPNVWAILITGAWCYYNNDPANGAVYGKLYNWYAVDDPRGLAPVGYHIPSDAEWTILTDYLGGTVIAGGNMKETAYWLLPNTAATNSSGFAGFPGGYRGSDGSFNNVGRGGYWWSATSPFTDAAWYRNLVFNSGNVGRYAYDKQGAFSVRCLGD